MTTLAALAVACSTKESSSGSKGDDTTNSDDEPNGNASTKPSEKATGDDDDDDDTNTKDTTGDKATATEWDCTGDLSCLFLDESGHSENVTVFFYGDGDTCKFDDPADKIATLELDGGKLSSDGDLVGSYTFNKMKQPTALHWDVGSGQRSLSNCKR